jgi:hypothetical protein
MARDRITLRIALTLAGLILPAVSVFAQNLSPNPSFESGTATTATSWAACQNSGAATFSIATSPVHAGTRSLRMDVTQSGDLGICALRQSVSPNQGYVFSAWLKAQLGRRAGLRVIEYSSALVVQADKTLATSSGETTDWEMLEGALTTGPNTTLLELRLMQSYPGTAGTGTFYWDDTNLGAIAGMFDEARATGCPAAQNPPACNEASSVGQWKCWQKTLTSTGYKGVNLYRDAELTVEFRNTATNTVARSGWGFWDCTQGNGNEAFRLRTALPAGTYSWQARCKRRVGAPTAGLKDCAADVKLNSSSYLAGGTASGTFTVTAATIGNDRYDRGFLTLSANHRFLKQGSTTVPFFWLADTAWAAIKKGNRGADWATYLESRRKQGFSVLLFGTTPAFAGVQPSDVFMKMTPCTPDGTPVPNNCSSWLPGYWSQYEAQVRDANEKGMVVVVAGLMEPFAYQNPTFGSPQWMSIFARNVAARLSGHHVIFSPGFDHLMTSTAQTLANSVGPAIDQAVPAHLITHHAGGGSTCADYTTPLQAQTWHDFHLFQSGHCTTARSVAVEQPCDPRRHYSSSPSTPDETAEQCVVRRAREMSSVLFTNPTAKPVVNGEAVYDNNPANQASTISPDNRAFLRQTGYLSTLSGSFGFTYGSNYFSLWQVQSTTLASQLGPVPITPGLVPSSTQHSAWDIQRMASIFKMRPWKELVPEEARILNQQTADDKKMVYAHTSSYRFNLAYLPNHPAGGLDPGNTRIRLNLSSLVPAFTCGSADWTATWLDPRSATAIAATSPLCQPVTGAFEFIKPASCGTCEWVLAIDRVGASTGGLTANRLQLWPDPTDGASGLTAQVLDSSGAALGGVSALGQGTKQFYRKQPKVARDVDGNFFTVWESEYQDGSLWGVFGRKLDADGLPLTDEFQINTYSTDDQAEPAVATSAGTGAAVVVWMSFDQDGDQGGIYGQLLDSSGYADGGEFRINTTLAGHQGSPLVGMSDDGSFAVAWESDGQDGDGLGIFVRRFDAFGTPLGREVQASPTAAGDQVLVNLEADASGGFVVSWYDYDSAGNSSGLVSRSFDSSGAPLN